MDGAPGERAPRAKVFSWCIPGIVLLLCCAIHAENKDADILFRDGIQFFYNAKPKESVAAFNKVIELLPKAAPQLWQRGLSLYYTEEFKEGRKQFELHQTVNPHDVENAAWHFICVARAESPEAARKALIPVEGDARVPMPQVHALFAGKGTEEAVMKAAERGDAGSDELRSQLCYAHLYLGLYHEALGHAGKAKAHMLKAAKDYRMDHYMGKTAQVHVKLRGWEK
jgi:lipoprotein NlpI